LFFSQQDTTLRTLTGSGKWADAILPAAGQYMHPAEQADNFSTAQSDSVYFRMHRRDVVVYCLIYVRNPAVPAANEDVCLRPVNITLCQNTIIIMENTATALLSVKETEPLSRMHRRGRMH